MFYKNKPNQKVSIFAWDTVNSTEATGDAANITTQYSIDGATMVSLTDTSPTEISSTGCPGIYVFDITQAESNGDMFILSPQSTGVGVSIDPVIIYPQDLLTISVTGFEDTADRHSLAAGIMIQTNASVAGTTLTAKKPSDDSTFQTYTLTTDATADPITGIS